MAPQGSLWNQHQIIAHSSDLGKALYWLFFHLCFTLLTSLLNNICTQVLVSGSILGRT